MIGVAKQKTQEDAEICDTYRGVVRKIIRRKFCVSRLNPLMCNMIESLLGEYYSPKQISRRL